MVYSNKRKETQEAINKAFIELYQGNCDFPITVKVVCELAEINLSTFYTYYTDIYDLQKYVEEEIQDKLIGEFKKILNKHVIFDINVITKELIDLFRANIDIPFLLIRRNKEGYIKKILKLAKEGMLFDTADMTEEDFWKLDIALKYHLTGVVNILEHCIVENKAFDVEEVIGLLAEIGSNGAFSVIKEYAFKENT